MAFQFKADAAVAETVGAGSGMNTGVFKVKVNAVVLSEDKKGNPRADFYFENKDGKRAIVFGMMINETWAGSGAQNYDYNKWQEFVAITGMATGATAPMEVQVSKDKKETKTVFTECTGKVVTVALQQKFDIQKEGKNAGKPTDDKSIYRTFNANGQTLAEAKTNTAAKYSVELKDTIKPYETPAYKQHIANGGVPAGQSSAKATPAAEPTTTVETADDVL